MTDATTPGSKQPVPRRSERANPSMFWVLAGLIVPLWSVIVRYRFAPGASLPRTGAFVLSPNHYSEIDPILVGVGVWHLGRLPRFLAKASIFRVPVLGWLMRRTGQVPVERANSANQSQSLQAATDLVRHGRGVIIYPEGSLTRDPELWPMRGKTGAVRLALQYGIPLIPAAHWGAQQVMPRYGRKISLFPRKTVQMIIGEPLDLSAFAGQPLDTKTLNAATEQLMAAITELLEQLRGEQAPPERWDPSRNNQSETGKF